MYISETTILNARYIAYNVADFGHQWWAWAAEQLAGTEDAKILKNNIQTWREAQSF